MIQIGLKVKFRTKYLNKQKTSTNCLWESTTAKVSGKVMLGCVWSGTSLKASQKYLGATELSQCHNVDCLESAQVCNHSSWNLIWAQCERTGSPLPNVMRTALSAAVMGGEVNDNPTNLPLDMFPV